MSAPRPPRASAVALSYADQRKAPVVVAKGYGVAAESIMRSARASGVYVHESPELVNLLMQVALDRQIPPALYLAVAEVMAWIARVESGGGRARDYHDSSAVSNRGVKESLLPLKRIPYQGEITR